MFQNVLFLKNSPIMDMVMVIANYGWTSLYMDFVFGIYGLPQAGILTNNLLKEPSKEHDNYKDDHVPELFRQKTVPIWYTLVVDGFGMKCSEKNMLDTSWVY